MIKSLQIMAFLSWVMLTLSITGVGLNPIRPLQLNKGLSTKYMFYINPQTSIAAGAQVQITFPSEFDGTAIAAQLSCLASTPSYAWKAVPCSFTAGSVVITLGRISNEQLNILVSQPTNPTIYSMSSFFSVCLMVASMTTSCSQTFGKVVFPDVPLTTNSSPTSPSITSLNTLVVGQSSTYQIQFSLGGTYTAGNTIRITFPPGFLTSSTPICQMKGTYNQVITTFVWPDQRSIQCQNINKTLATGESLKIIGIFNPQFSGTFGNTVNGFKLQILQQTTTIVLEQIFIQDSVEISSGTLTGYISQANSFINGDVVYTFYLNLLNSLTSSNFILISFDSSWLLYSGQCTVISGITLSPFAKLSCTNSTATPSKTVLNVSNFLSASVSNQLVFSITVRSPASPDTSSTVGIRTANINGTVDSMTATVNLNSTYGDYSMLSINAIVAQSNVPVSGTGPLELTFFLNYPLPQTNVLTFGKFVVKIYPQIPLPPPLVNGVLKCYFFNTIPAQTCVWDTSTSASYTLLTINTPLTMAYQYSEIPITITTEGAISTSKIGITIADIVTRYRFELAAYQHNNSLVPTEVYFSEYIAAPIALPLTYYALTKEVNEYTHLRFEFTSPYNFTSPLTDDLRIKIEFLAGGAWAPNLGYNPNSIYKNFPCVFSDNKLQTLPPQYNSKVQCDFYTYLTGPHASLTNATARGPYILVSGFTNQMYYSSEVRLELGRFLIGSSTNLAAYIRFSLVQETPTMLTKYVELYYKEFSAFTTTSQSVPTAGSGILTDTIFNSQINIASKHTIAYTAPSSFFAVIYEFDQISTPSFTNQFVECTIGTSPQINWCTMLGYPVNYIVEYSYLGTFGTAVNSQLNFTNGVYAGTFPARARLFSSSSLTIYKQNFNVVYTPYTIVSYTFSMDTGTINYLYKGVETYFTIRHRPIYSTPDNGFIRFIFSSGIQLGEKSFCTSSDFVPFVTEVGLICTIESAYSLKISNIRGLVGGNDYTVRLRLKTELSTTTSVTPKVTVQDHYTIAADPSIVNQVNTLSMSPGQTNYYTVPNEFKMDNPRIAFQTPIVGYVGKFQVIFKPSGDVLVAYQIKLILKNHAWNGGLWTTPNNVPTDPMVCMINYVRVPCTYTLGPLTVIMNVSPAGIVSSQNNILTLDTEYLVPINGIVHPSQGGQYSCYLQFLTDTNTVIQQQSFYTKILPPRLANFYVNSTVNDVGVENMFYVQIKIGSQAVNANNNAGTYSRIFIEFPTVDANGNTLFANDLGGYSKTGDIVGCAFDTWSSWYVGSVTSRLMCRLIMSEVPGEPVRVEIINHNYFSASYPYMRLWIAKVFNPAIPVTSLPISIRINHVVVATNDIYELYYDTFDVFMNSQNPNPTFFNTDACTSAYDDCSGTCQIMNGNIYGRDYFRLSPRPMTTSFNSNDGYYYVLDTTSVIKPRSLQDEYSNNYCHGSYYKLCLAFPDINYFIIWGMSSNYYVKMYFDAGNAISQYATNLVAKVWVGQRYIGTHTLTLSTTCWNQLRGSFSSVSVSTTSSNAWDLYLGRRKVEVGVTFTTTYKIPATGSIIINWPSSILRIYPHCRSMTNLGSALNAEGTTNTKQNGEVGCLVQNTRQWVITGFNALNGGSVVKIVGLIDLPISQSGYIGGGEIITFNNTHPTDIRSNGFIIDYYYSASFGIDVNNAPSHNADGQIVFDETLPLRVGYHGPLRFKFSLASDLIGPNAGVITVRVPGVSTIGQAGGFSYVSAEKHVCQIMQITTYEETGCIITGITTDNNATSPSYLFRMITSSTLAATTLYRMVITTHTGTQPEGLVFPTAPGTYKIDFNFDTTGSTGLAIHNQLYLEVYGTKFTLLQATAFCTCPGKKNIIWIKLTPTTTIQTTQQLVIEVPTVGANGNLLFANDLGTGVTDGVSIPYDNLGSSFSQTFMTCRVFHGDRNTAKPGKIVCGQFSSTISSGQILFFAFSLGNPSSYSGVQVSIPFFVYSQEQGTTFRTNFDVIENAVFLRNDVNQKSDGGWIYTQNQRLQTSGMFIEMITRNHWNIGKDDYYLLLFNFPLRVNGLVTGGCTYQGSSIYGDAYYHQNLWVIVCAVTHASNYISIPGAGFQTRNLRISNFYTPFYYLSSNERVVTAYTYLFSSKITGIGYITDLYPNESPKLSGNPTMSLSPIHHTSTSYAGSRDDYTITFTYNTAGATVDLSFTQLIAFIFPTSSYDYVFPESDCVESPSSQVEIASCYIDTAQGIIWITPVIKSSYTSNMAVSITTRNLAIRNPVSNINLNANAFVVKYYSWQNISKPSLLPRSNDNHCFLMINNFPSSGINYATSPSGYQVGTFSYIKYPHQRYYQDTPFSSLVHRAPFEMEFYPTVAFSAQSGSNYNMIKIVYPSSFTDNAMVKIRDLQVFRPICYLYNKRIKDCVIDVGNNAMTMSFQFALATNTKYHIKFSILDSRNADIDGFLASAAVSSVVLMYKPHGAGNWYYTETDQFPSLYSLPTGASAGPFRGIVAGTPTYGHAVANQLNFVNLLLTFNRTDITGLVFEIPSVDMAGTALFSQDSHLTATFMGQSNGGSYPCGNNGLNAGGSVKCLLLTGDYSSTGVVTRIIMTGFTYQTQMNCRFTFFNPPTVNAYFSVIVRAFGGASSSLNPYGNQYMGSWEFNEIFQIVSSPTVYTNSYVATSYNCPNQSPWRNNTIFYAFSRDQDIGIGRSSIASVKLYDSSSSMSDKSFCESTLGSAFSYDDLLQYTLVSGGDTTKYAYFIRTWSQNKDVSIGSSGWGLSYLKCKYFTGIQLKGHFFFANNRIEVATNTFSTSHCNGYTQFSSPVSKYFSQNYFVADGTDTSLVHEIDITPTLNSMTNFGFRSGDAMVLSISYGANPWGTLISCDLLGGVLSTSINQRAFCNVGSNSNIYIVNVGGFVSDPLLATTTNYRIKFRLLSSGLTNTPNNINFYFYLKLFANLDAYTATNYHPIINEYNSVITGSTTLCYYNQAGSCIISQTSAPTGTFQVQSLSDTFMRVAFSPSSSIAFGGTTSITHTFLITFDGFNFGPACSVSNVVFEYSTSSTPGSGTNNTVAINTATCDYNHIQLSFTGRAFANYWGGVSSANGGTYAAGHYIIFYVTVSPDPSGRDLPTYHHEYLFLQGSYSSQNSGWTIRIQNTVTMPALSLASSATLSTLSNNVGGTTELSFTISSASIAFGPQNNGYWLLAEFLGTSGWTGSNDPFGTYTNTALLDDTIACKCISGASPLTISAASPIIDANCIRKIPNSTFNNYAILISTNVAMTNDLICFFPEFKIASSASFSVEFKLVYGDVDPPELTSVSTKYSSLYRVSSNTLNFGTTPTMSISGFSTITETPNFYASATNIGSSYSGSYSLSGSWSGGLNKPYIYINFLSSGPIPVNNFCSDLNVFLQCRVYSNLVYVVVAQMKSTSVSSFNISNSGATLLYPPSQTSLSNYGANIYVGVNSWQYSTSLSRSQNNLTPLSASSIFRVYSDKYGSNMAGYPTNLFFSFNPTGQSLFNNFVTRSQLVISWNGNIATTNCQVWVQGEPLVRLQCTVASTTSLVVISPYYDYATSNNIIISIGLQNPSTTTTFSAKLYSYYYSLSRHSLTISLQSTYSTDANYTSYTQISKATVSMYPFYSRISTVANAPMRIRFVLPSSTVGNSLGRLKFTYSQIQYSTAHLCYIIVYNSYTAMMQQTQRTVYRTGSCTSSGSVLTVVPPAPLVLSASIYYELVMMPLNIDSTGCSNYGCVTQSGYQQLNFDPVTLVAYNNINTNSIISQQVNMVYNYEGSSFIGLQQIYILCTQPIITSLYLSININFTSSNNFPTHYLQITLYDIKITAFSGYSIGDIFPCQLSNNFLSINARQPPQCRVVMADLLNTFVTVRIENIGFLSPQTYWVTFDDITLPTPTPSDNNKFDIDIAYYGPSNLKYLNYFPEIFQIDNTNSTVPVTSSSYTFNNPALTGFGNPIVGQVIFSWPFDTTSTTDYGSKIALNFNGGYSAIWKNINSVTFVDSMGTYQILWVNTKLNKFVFLIPKKGNAVSTTLNITSLNNPYPYQKELYNFNSTNMIINFYNNFFLANKQTFLQPSFNIFTMNPSLVYINQNYPCNTIDNYGGNTFAPASLNMLLLSISFDQTAENILARNLGNINIKFTNGISSIRECRAMRNNSQYINTVQVCQPHFDGTNWFVKLYDVANSQLTTGWWVQVFATFNSATLSYTSYVMASNNLEVQYESPYTVTLLEYNTSRSIPTKLSWLNNKYVANFYETQYKFLQAIPNQATQYIKFRFKAPRTSSQSSDVYYIYLSDDQATQPFRPKTTLTNVIGQFLPSMGPGDNDFSVGSFAQCDLSDVGSYYRYDCYMRYGGLIAGYDYLVQLSEYNTATSSFYMPTSPSRQQIRFQYHYYPSSSNQRYYEVINVYSYRLFTSAQFLHTTTTVSDYQTITINYTPYGSLAAASSISQIALRLSVEARYHAQDGGITDIYTADSKTLQSGSQFSGVVNNPNGVEINTIQFSQYSIELAPLRFSLAQQSAYTDNTAYYWIVPLLKNPDTAYISLRYNLTLVTSPSGSYEYIFNHYESLNEYFTVSSTSTSFATSITNNLRAVQTTNAVDLSVNLGSYSLAQWNTAIFKVNNALPGLLQNIANPNDTSNYNYYYFGLLNMIMAQKKNGNTVTTIGIGSSSSVINYQSTFGLSWVRVFNNSNAPLAYNPSTLFFSTPPTLTLTHLTSYAASSITLIEGYQSQGSTAMYRVTFTTPIIPQAGQIRILFNNNVFTSNSNGSCRVNTNFAKSSTGSEVLRCYRVSEGFRIAGYNAIAASTSVSAYIMLQSTAVATASPIQVDIFGKYQDNSTRISLASVGTVTHTAGTVPSDLYRLEQTVVPYFSTIRTANANMYRLQGTFNLRLATLQNGDYIYISETGWEDNNKVRRLLIKQNSTAVTGWTELQGHKISSNYYRFTFPTNYLMTQSAAINTQYLFKYQLFYAPYGDSGFQTGGTGVSRFWVTTQDDGNIKEIGYYDFVPYPKPFVLTINNRYTAAGRQTVLDLSWTSDINIAPGNTLTISFDTSNLLNQMFANDLEGAGTNGATYRYLDCREWYNNAQISDNRIVCLLNFGNNLANPPIPANLSIVFQKNNYGYTTSQGIRILIANVMNPTTEGLNTGVTLNVFVPCENQQNQPCSGYAARGKYVTSSSTENLQATATTFTSSSPLVLTTGLTHTFTLVLTANIGTSHAIYIVYPENFQGLMPSNCAVTNYYCYVFPTRRWVVLYPTTTINAGTITLAITSMNNPYYSQPHSQYFLVTVARSASSVVGDTYKILQNPFTPVSYSFPTPVNQTAFSVATTQTPNMYLRNYANTVIFTISNLFSDSRIKAIYILAPTDVTSWDPTYCNASITITSNFNYPLRFTCIVDPNTPQYLRLTLDSDMATYDSSWALMNIRVHAKFTLADFSTAPTLYVTTPVTSNPFYAYSSMNATSSSSIYYMSQCSLTISISQNQVPVISVINFNTQSFANRQARVNNKEVFYMLFKPLVNVDIGSIVFTIPSQFNYPGVFQFDNCLMIGRTTITQPNCQLSRSQGQTLVTLVPANNTYDNQVKIIQIGTVQQTNWFTAPSLPGDFYNMNVAIYSPTGTLIAKQTRNISPVYGQSFDIPSMTIKNVQDVSSKFAVYDLTFVTGSLQIPPGTLTTATTQMSELQFIFQNFNGMNPTNVFPNDLGTGLRNGDQIGCNFFSGLVAVSGLRLKCLLYVGTNATNKPMIRVINYNFINPQTTIIIGFAGIQSLPAVLVNTISIGVVIYYTDIGSSTYLYIPTPIITVPTNSTSIYPGMQDWTVNASYSGTNIVLQPTTFTISFRIPDYYWLELTPGSWGYYTYSSTGASDQFILLTFYPPTLLDKNNPTPITCPLCTSVDVYYASGTVRFRHSSSVGRFTNKAFQFNNFPTSAYSMLNQTVKVYFQVYQSYRTIYQRNVIVNLSRTVEKCTKFNFGVVSVSSLNGGEIGVTYLFSIKTNHFVPADGALSITIPTVYGNLISNMATCTLIGFANTDCYCRILTPSRVDIYANGTELSPSTTYSIQITGMQNPNVQSSSFVFIVTSYYVSNIYLGLKICENQIIPPAINVKPLRTCTLSWTPQYYNQNFNTSYIFQLSCSDVFRGDSILYISLPTAYSSGNKLGRYSCSSYESTTLVSPVCTLQNINGVFTLTTSIDASSQSSLSLILNLVNPINNTYVASAYVNSKGTQYASSGNSSITILSNSYSRAQSSDVSLLNMPKEAGLMSTYAFKISPISTFAPSNLGITFPSNFYIDSTKITVSILNNAQNNIFSLLTYNNIQSLISNASAIAGTRISSYPTFKVIGTSIYLTSISGQVSSSLWTYVFVSNIQNPSAYVYANFTVAYYLISNGFQALQWAFQNPLTYYISSPPKYISINSVSVTDLDLLYPANYTFNISADSAIGISGKNVSYIIVIPTFYKNTLWANTPPVCKFSVLSAASSCYSYQSEIIITEVFPANYTALSLTISTLLNPALPTSCNTTDTSILAQTFFIVRIIDTVSNSFLFESSSVVDASNCLTFSAIRIPISLEYSLIMTAGLAYNITYGLSKPSSNLKITAYISNSGFTFSPATVDFNNFYTLTQSTQLFLRSDVSPGTYIIYFSKFESSNQTYFRNILPVAITVSASNTSSFVTTPTISIPSMSDSTVGYPVTIPILFSLPSSTEMTLFMSVSEQSNQTLAQYSSALGNFSITPRIFNILPQQTKYSYTVSQKSQIVPPPLTLNFKLTSNYPIVHNLTTPKMYLCFDRDPKFNVLYPPLRVTVTQFLSSCNMQDVGKQVTNIYISNQTSQSSAGSVTPKIISMAVSSVASTGAVITVNSISIGTIYYACISAGYAAITDAALLISMNNSQGIAGSAQSTALDVNTGQTAQINFVATATIVGLNQSSNYVFYALSRSNLGTSSIASIAFSTTVISNGVQLRMSFTTVVTNLELVNALVQSLRVNPGRIKILTSTATLARQANISQSSNNKPKFVYDIVLAPDEANDVISPLTTIQNFAKSRSALASFQTSIPSFDISTPITYFELRPVDPQMSANPQTVQVNNYNATFKVSFKAQSNVYAVLIESVGTASNSLLASNNQISPVTVGSLSAAARSVAPSSSQIKAGKDHRNRPLGKYKVVHITTNFNGEGQLVFSDLKEKSVYVVYMTASNTQSYEPTMLWKDLKVITFTFSTLPNPNVGDSKNQLAYIDQLASINRPLADEMRAFIRAQESKAKAQNKK